MTQSEREVRIQKIDRIRALGVQPYPGGFAKNHSIDELVVLGEKSKDTFRGIEEIVDGPRDDYQTAGRVMLHRSFGKLLFGKLKDQHGEIQFAASKQSCRVIDAT